MAWYLMILPLWRQLKLENVHLAKHMDAESMVLPNEKHYRLSKINYVHVHPFLSSTIIIKN